MYRPIAASAVALAVAGWCLRQPIESRPGQPLRVAVLQDLSLSAGPNGIATVQTDELRDLANAISPGGGEVVFGLIARRDEPLVRLRVAPQEPGNAYQQNAARLQIRKEADHFLDLSASRLRSEPSPVTDLTAAIHRVNRFFQEPAARGARQALILISDCIHDASRIQPPDVAEGVAVVVVAGGKRPPVRRAVYFEGVAAAISHVIQGGR